MDKVDRLLERMANMHRTGKSVVNISHAAAALSMEILDSDLPPQEKSASRLSTEAFLLLGAGTDPLTRNMFVIMYYVLADQAMLERVHAELKSVISRPYSPVTLAELEALPLFSACITEGLRITNAVSTRTLVFLLSELYSINNGPFLGEHPSRNRSIWCI